MSGSSSWQSLRWMMALTAYVAVVAVVAIAVRSVAGPVATEGTSLRWATLTLVLACSLFLPAGRAVAAVVFPRDIADEPRCPRCARAELRPLRTGGRGIFDPAQRYRCGACWTLFDVEDGALVERPEAEDAEPPRSPDIWFVESGGGEATDAGIEFLGDVGPPSRTSAVGPCLQDN